MDKRLDPRLLVEGARTVVSVALNYYPAEKLNGWVLSRYVYGQDYHDVVKERLRQLAAHIPPKEGYETRVFVDTAPLDERYWAWRCGLGWQGRSGQLILPKGGTYFFLGEIVLPYEADVYDTPIENRCGTCHACIDACPGQALRGDGTLDANRCLSLSDHRKPWRPTTGDGTEDGSVLLRLRPLRRGLPVESICQTHRCRGISPQRTTTENDTRGLEAAHRRTVPRHFQRVGSEARQV